MISMPEKLLMLLFVMAGSLCTYGQQASTKRLEPPLLLSKNFGMSMRDKLSAEDYRKLTSSGSIVLIDFYATWCGPCKLMEPMLQELTEELKGRVEVVRINVDENKTLMSEMAIWEIPVVKIYKDGKEAWSRVGYVEKRVISKQLRKL